jgi:hypothetical protein
MVMRILTNFLAGAIIAMWLGVVGYFIVTFSPKSQVINCTWSEISPDFTPEARDMCRKLRMEKVK